MLTLLAACQPFTLSMSRYAWTLALSMVEPPDSGAQAAVVLSFAFHRGARLPEAACFTERGRYVEVIYRYNQT